MTKTPIYQRSELPPGETGLVKPPYQLADQSGMIQFGQTVTRIVGEYWQDWIRNEATTEFYEFQNRKDAILSEYANKIAQKPGASIEEFKAWKQEALQKIQSAGDVARTRAGRRRIRQWYTENTKSSEKYPNGALQTRMDLELTQIQLKRQAERNQAILQRYIETGNTVGV